SERKIAKPNPAKKICYSRPRVFRHRGVVCADKGPLQSMGKEQCIQPNRTWSCNVNQIVVLIGGAPENLPVNGGRIPRHVGVVPNRKELLVPENSDASFLLERGAVTGGVNIERNVPVSGVFHDSLEGFRYSVYLVERIGIQSNAHDTPAKV